MANGCGCNPHVCSFDSSLRLQGIITMKTQNLDYNPGFWLAILVIIPFALMAEGLWFIEKRLRTFGYSICKM